MVILPPEQGNGYERILKLGEDDVSSSLKTLLKDVASEANNSVAPSPQLKRKATTLLEGFKLEMWRKHERSTYPGTHPVSIGNTTTTVFIRAIPYFQVVPD